MILEKSNIPKRKKGHWHNITCSSKYIYLTAYKWGTFIYQYSIDLSELNQQWQTPITCSKNESIDHFIHNQVNQLVLIIQNRLNYQKQDIDIYIYIQEQIKASMNTKMMNTIVHQ